MWNCTRPNILRVKSMKRRIALEVESLEGRTVLSAFCGRALGIGFPIPAVHTPPPPHHHHLVTSGDIHGIGRGSYTHVFTLANEIVSLVGTGTFGVLGQVHISGSVDIGFVPEGQATGLLTFSNIHGSVTLRLTSSQVAWVPSAYQYKVVSGTGIYRSFAGTGTLHLQGPGGAFSLVLDSVPTISTGIQGIAMVGPLIGASNVYDLANIAPYANSTLVIEAKGGGPEIARVVTDASGQFQIALPPGDYQLVLPPGPPPYLPLGQPLYVHVVQGQVSVVEFDVFSGIL
jgi:hypothetical protein